MPASARGWKPQAGEGYNFAAYGADVADHASCQELAGLIQTDGHHIDILVNNAGITRDATFRKLSYADWDAVLRVNLDSVFNVTRPFIDGMLERGWGRIVNIASINGSKGQFGQTNYSAAKAGMHGFTKALAQEVARKGRDGQHRLAGVSGYEDGDEHVGRSGQTSDCRYSRGSSGTA